MSFDALAPHYRWMECVLAGEKLQRSRTAFLGDVPIPKKILLVGEGPGRCLLECRRQFAHAAITCLDASQSMLDQARRQLERHNARPAPLNFVQADILHWRPDGDAYDLIITNFFLDCFRADQLLRIVSKLGSAATTDGHWLLADFQKAASGVKRIRSRLILWTMYTFFRMATQLPARELTAPDVFLEHVGFTLHRRIESEWGLIHSDWWRRRSN
jgi:ubiquinone/menaquinone biosynthesis C-methylase UbiE